MEKPESITGREGWSEGGTEGDGGREGEGGRARACTHANTEIIT